MKKWFTVVIAFALTLIMGFATVGCGKELIGFDIELAKAVAAKLDLSVEFIEIDWDVKEAELENKSIDVAWNGFTYTEERDHGYFDEERNKQIGGLDFSGMYMKNKQVGIVKKENAQKFATFEGQSQAKSFVAEMGSAGLATVREVFGKTAVGVDKQLTVFNEVSSGTADIGVIDAVMAGYYVTAESSAYYNTLAVVEIESAEEEFYAIGCREGSNLPAVLNQILAGMWADGTIAEIAAKYGLQNVLVNDFGTYDENYTAPDAGDFAEIAEKGKLVVGYTLFAPMAYKG